MTKKEENALLARVKRAEAAFTTAEASLTREVDSLRRRLNNSLARLDAFDKHATERHMDAVHDKAKAVRARMNVELHKTTVTGELVRLALRSSDLNAFQVMMALVITLDAPEEWWAKTEDWTINRWVKHLKTVEIPRV